MVHSVNNMSRFIQNILRYIFPKKCFGCQKWGYWACDKCIEKIPLARNSGEEWIYSIFPYENKVIRKSLLALKFKGGYSVLNDLESAILTEFKKFKNLHSLETTNCILVPIPTTKINKQKRGYDQSVLIAKKLKGQDRSVKIDQDFLIKTKNHISQNKIKDKTKRFENIKDSFVVKRGRDFSGKTIILIDDITTTGATLGEARRTIKNARVRVKKILAFTIAH